MIEGEASIRPLNSSVLVFMSSQKCILVLAQEINPYFKLPSKTKFLLLPQLCIAFGEGDVVGFRLFVLLSLFTSCLLGSCGFRVGLAEKAVEKIGEVKAQSWKVPT